MSEVLVERILSVLRAPDGGGPLRQEGDRLVDEMGRAWPIVRGIPRFVADDEYAASFSFEWTTHDRTQLDIHNDDDASARTLTEKTGLTAEDVRGKLVLDAGTGAGRFADVLSRWGADVACVDLSWSVEAARRNLMDRGNVLVAQADIRHLPFGPATFDFVISIGVLHHTPDTRAAMLRLVPLLKPGGTLCIWVYPDTPHYRLRRLWSPFLRRLPPRWFYAWCRRFVPLARARQNEPLLRAVRRYFEWSEQSLGIENDILDTFDAYSPRYHWTHTPDEVTNWFREAGLTQVEALAFETAVRGVRPG